MTAFTLPRLAALTAIVAVGTLVPAAAGATPGPRADLIVKLLVTIADTNTDGKIDAAEMAALRDRRFADLDANQDGVVSADEMAHAVQRAERRVKLLTDAVGVRFTGLDTNGDSAVSKAEYAAAPQGLIWSLADVDGDGAISTDELGRVAAALAK
jgi:Ca2+-binding EF-hand superfamily protein